MRHQVFAALLAASGLGLGHCSAVGEPQHPHPTAKAAPKVEGQASVAADPLNRADPHVAQLFNILRRARAEGDKLDMAKLRATLKDVARAHAIEYEIDPAASEKMIEQTAHKAWMAAQQHPENLNSLEAFNKSIGAW
jgi:hypothetical protein